MYTSQELSSRIKEVARENNVSIGEMLKCCGLSVNTLANMRTQKESAPNPENHGKIAALNTSCEILLTSENPTGPPAGPQAYTLTRSPIQQSLENAPTNPLYRTPILKKYKK